MAFQVDQELNINGIQYRIAEHPAAPGVPYGQEGRAATVYKLHSENAEKALKVFKKKYRTSASIQLTNQLKPYAQLHGLMVCDRTVISPQSHAALLSGSPQLQYAVVMPWIDGSTWMDLVLEKHPVTPFMSFDMARQLLKVLIAMEERGIAHCDLSGANVMLPLVTEGDGIQLVDVEQLYSRDLKCPDLLTAGTPGYVHPRLTDGNWNASADRFSGAILLVEMLAWCDKRIREASWDESYFDQNEIQQDTARYRLLLGVINERYGEGISSIFRRVWHSQTPDDCPPASDWYLALEGKPVAASAGPSLHPLLDVVAGPKATSPEAETRSAVASGDGTTQAEPFSAENESSLESAEPAKTGIRPNSTSASEAVETFGENQRWTPDIPEQARTSVLRNNAALFLGVASALGIFVILFQGLLDNIAAAFWRSGGWAPYVALSAGSLSFAIGLVQIWVFRQRIPNNERITYVLWTTVSGTIAGFITGAMITMRVTDATQAGLFIGILGGALSGIVQSFLMRNNEAKLKWFIWNSVGWFIAWFVGWPVGLMLNRGGWIFAGLSAFLIASIMGVFLLLFLKTTPEFEF